jgi:hypothetical protein
MYGVHSLQVIGDVRLPWLSQGFAVNQFFPIPICNVSSNIPEIQKPYGKTVNTNIAIVLLYFQWHTLMQYLDLYLFNNFYPYIKL